MYGSIGAAVLFGLIFVVALARTLRRRANSSQCTCLLWKSMTNPRMWTILTIGSSELDDCFPKTTMTTSTMFC